MQSLLTAIADKKKSGKSSKPFSIEELLEFQGLNRLEVEKTKKIYTAMTTDIERLEEKQKQIVKKQNIKQKLFDKFGIR